MPRRGSAKSAPQPAPALIKITNDAELKNQILRAKAKAYEAVSKSNKVLKDEAIERQGGVAARQEIFTEQAEPITLQSVTARKENDILTKIQNGVPLTKAEQAYYSNLTASATLPNPPNPAPASLADIAPEPDLDDTILQIEPPSEPTSIRSLVTAFGMPARSDTIDKTQLSMNDAPTGFKFGSMPVSITPEASGGYILSVAGVQLPLTQGLLVLLVGNQTFIDGNLNSITRKDLDGYIKVLEASNVSFDNAKSSKKKKVIVQMRQQAGLGIHERTRKPPKSQAMLVQPAGSFGDLKVDMHQLGQGVVHVMDGEGTLVYHGKGSPGLIHLLTQQAHKGQAGKRFTEDDLKHYHTLAEMAKVPVKATNNRARLAQPGVKEGVFIDGDPKTMAERLDTLLGLHGSGNKSTALTAEAMVLADRLLRDRQITKKAHKDIFHALL